MSSNPLQTLPRRSAALAPRLFPAAGYYALLARYGSAAADTSMRYDKRDKATHRFDIADHGRRVSITIPVSRPEGAFAGGRLTWDDIIVSAHGRWWDTVPDTLATAYGRTPFFEFYIDRLRSILSSDATGKPLRLLLADADTFVRKALGLHATAPVIADDADDLRSAILPDIRPYHQLHSPGEGFISGLSVLDLLFCTGPEAPLYLQQTAVEPR